MTLHACMDWCHQLQGFASPSFRQYACWLIYKMMLYPHSAELMILWLPLAGPGQMGQPQRASTKQMQLAASWATQRACTRRTTNTEWAALPERSAAICSAESPDDKSHAGGGCQRQVWDLDSHRQSALCLFISGTLPLYKEQLFSL